LVLSTADPKTKIQMTRGHQAAAEFKQMVLSLQKPISREEESNLS
jgi:hypothetical protein